MVVICGWPKGLFNDCAKWILSGMSRIEEELGELGKLGIIGDVREVDFQHWETWMAGVYLMFLVQLLENTTIIELTHTKFLEAQKVLKKIVDWFGHFPTILQGCENTIQMILGQYAHSLGFFNEFALHFIEATKLIESKSMQAMC